MEYEHLGLLHDMFRRQAALTPDKIAVVDADGRQMTFKELDEVTDAVGINLQYRGVVPDTVVGIYMQRRLEYVISYIAILKAGGAYMTIDPSYPPPLLEDILSDSHPVAILTEDGLETQVAESKNVILCERKWIDQIKRENEEFAKTKQLPTEKPNLDSLAYTVYSSGSTGKPKGIQCPHRGAVFSYNWRHLEYPYTDDDREACNIFFVWEMLRPMLKGIPCYIIPDHVIYDPKLLCDYISKNKITRILFTPSLLETVINSVDVSESFKTVKLLIFCGEVVTTILLDRCIKALPNTQIINLYSVSEAHDISCSDLTQWVKQNPAQFKERKYCSVGSLLPRVNIFIMDDDLNVQPVGKSGEMYVATPGLARGYLNRPKINAERFISRPDSVGPQWGTRLYKTGDWGYMMSDSTFEICGRCDTMVKIRGYSVEKQAIETYLLDLPMVNSCVVLVHGEEGEDKSLVAYVVPEGQTTKREIRTELKKLLPFYMIPTYFVFLKSIPMLVSAGKLDKKALPPVHQSDEFSEELSQCTPTEKSLIPLWQEVLSLKAIDIHESFFDMGGHSLLATKLVTMVEESFAITLAVRDVFLHSTLTAMAKLIDSRSKDSNEETPPPEEVDLQQEVERHDQKITSLDIQLRAFWRSAQFSDRWDHCRVLLTGCTGFLGSFILRDLLLNTKTHVFCLVRGSANDQSMGRIKSALRKFGIIGQQGQKSTEQQSSIEEMLDSRLSPIVGDVGLLHLGMSLDDYQYLSTEIDAIIHAAAYVNLIYPYQMLYAPNVIGTQNIISFASTSKVKPLHYISTDAVFPHGLSDCAEDADMSVYATQLTDGYAKTKWVAEQLVIRAMNRGMPVAIYRPGNLSGDSKHAFWNPEDFTLLMIRGCAVTGVAPRLDWNMDMTPVDFVSSFVVTLVHKMSLGLGSIYHLVNPQPIKSDWLFEWMNARGYSLKMLDYNDWVERLKNIPGEGVIGHKLKGLMDNMASDASFFSELSTYRQDNVNKILSIIKKSYPPINYKLLNTYLTKLRSRKILPSIRRNTTLDCPLADMVAIVTGASSGIGAAIALHMARSGARVALAARRGDKMAEIKQQIEQDNGICISVPCDVTDRKQVEELVRHTESTLGPVDVLVNNAGVMYYTMMKNLQLQQWDQQVDINCKGVLNCVGAVVDGMIKRHRGHIVNMSSDAGRRGFAGLAVYSGTKFFIEGLSQGMRHELCQHGIKVTCIQPGDVKTELLTHSTDKEARDAYDGSGSNQILDPDDIARAVVYACSQPSHCSINEILIEPKTAPI